jgi:hypothetical protein
MDQKKLNGRVLGRVGARELTAHEISRVNGGTHVVLPTAIMTFFGTNDPDTMPDVFPDL